MFCTTDVLWLSPHETIKLRIKLLFKFSWNPSNCCSIDLLSCFAFVCTGLIAQFIGDFGEAGIKIEWFVKRENAKAHSDKKIFAVAWNAEWVIAGNTRKLYTARLRQVPTLRRLSRITDYFSTTLNHLQNLQPDIVVNEALEFNDWHLEVKISRKRYLFR